MITIYDYADALRALADKKDLQICNNGDWNDVKPAKVLHHILDGIYKPELIRVKPKTVVINGIECPERFGQPTDHTVTVTWRSEREREGHTLEFYYSDKQGAEATFNALVRPLGAITE